METEEVCQDGLGLLNQHLQKLKGVYKPALTEAQQVPGVGGELLGLHLGPSSLTRGASVIDGDVWCSAVFETSMSGPFNRCLVTAQFRPLSEKACSSNSGVSMASQEEACRPPSNRWKLLSDAEWF